MWVRPFTENDYGGTWASTSIRLNTPPKLLAPIGGTYNTTPTLSCSPGPPTQTYEVWARQTSPERVDRIVDLAGIHGTSVSFTTPLAPGDYEWWVRATEANGFKSRWSEVGRFNTVGRPTVTGPIGTTSLKPIITWEAVPGATRYRVWVDDDSGRRVAHTTNASGTSFIIQEKLAAGTEHTVWVKSFDNGSGGPWSQAFTFTTTPDRPVVLGPTGAIEDATPRFTWTPTKGAESYEVWVNDLTNHSSRIIHQIGLEAETFQPTAPMGAGDYRVWVRAIHSDATFGVWSAAVDFTIVRSEATRIGTSEIVSALAVLPSNSVAMRIMVTYEADDDRCLTQAAQHRESSHIEESRTAASRNSETVDSVFAQWDTLLAGAMDEANTMFGYGLFRFNHSTDSPRRAANRLRHPTPDDLTTL